MLFNQDREQMRRFFFSAWQKQIAQQPLEALEQQVVQVILDHPEYHALFNQPDKYINKDYLPEFGETNPFLHLSLHLGIREQLSTDRPAGIRALYQKLLKKYGDPQTVEHQIMEALVEALFKMQQGQNERAEKEYLENLQKLI